MYTDDPAVLEMQQLQFNERHFHETDLASDTGVEISQSQSERLSRSLDIDLGQEWDALDSASTAQCNHHSYDNAKGHARSASSGGDRRVFGHILTNGGGSGSDLDEPDQSDKIKNKLMSAWNNMRHGNYQIMWSQLCMVSDIQD